MPMRVCTYISARACRAWRRRSLSASARASGRYAVCTEGLCRAASLIVGKRKGFAHVYRNARDLGQGGAELPPHNILLVCLRVYVPDALYIRVGCLSAACVYRARSCRRTTSSSSSWAARCCGRGGSASTPARHSRPGTRPAWPCLSLTSRAALAAFPGWSSRCHDP